MNIRKIAEEVAEDYINSHPNCDEETIYCIIEEAIPRWNDGDYNNPVTFFNIQIRNTLYQLGLYESKTTHPTPNEAMKPTEIAEKEQISEPTDNEITNFITDETEKLSANEPIKTEIAETEKISEPTDNETADSPVIESIETTKQEDNLTQTSTPKMSNELKNLIIEDLIAGETIRNVALKYDLKLSTTRNNVWHWQKKGLFPEGFVPVSDKKRKKSKEKSITSDKTKTNEIIITEEPIDSEPKSSMVNIEAETTEPETENIVVTPEIESINADAKDVMTNDEVNTIEMGTETKPIIENPVKTDEQLTFVTATQNIIAFMEQQLHNSKLITVIADEMDKTLHCKYMTPDNAILCINIKRYDK